MGDAALVLSAVSQALGSRTGGDRALLEVLLAYLGERRLLLFLDGFEHLPGAAPEVAEIAGSCPSLTVRVRICGSRNPQPLGLDFRGRIVEGDASVGLLRA